MWCAETTGRKHRREKNPPSPKTLVVYEALYALNRHFERVLADITVLVDLLGSSRQKQKLLQACRTEIEEARAHANLEVLEILVENEQRSWFRLGSLSRQK